MNPAASDTVVVVIEAVDVGNVVVDVGRGTVVAVLIVTTGAGEPCDVCLKHIRSVVAVGARTS